MISLDCSDTSTSNDLSSSSPFRFSWRSAFGEEPSLSVVIETGVQLRVTFNALARKRRTALVFRRCRVTWT